MPISLVPGSTGAINAGGSGQQQNPFEGFAQQLLAAKQMQRQEAMQQLEWMANMAERSRGKFLPDPAEVDKLVKKAGLPKMMTSEGGGDTAAMFKGIGESAAKMEGLESNRITAATEASQAQTAASKAQTGQITLETEHAQMLQNLEAILADDAAPSEKKSQASLMLMAAGKLTPEAGALMSATPSQRSAVMDTIVKRATGEMTDTEKSKYIIEQATATKDDFDSIDDARKYWGAILSGQTPTVMPKISPAKLKDNLMLYATGAELGLSPQMMNEYIAAKGDVSKIKNWPAAIKTTAMKQLEIMEKELGLKAREVAVAERGVAVSEREEKSASAKRIADAWAALSKGEDEELAMAFNAMRQAQLSKNPLAPKIVEAIQDKMAAKFGLVPVETKSILGLWTSRGYEFGGKSDSEALKDVTTETGGDMGAGLFNPAVMGGAITRTLKAPMDIENAVIKGAPGAVKAGAEEIADFIEKFLKGAYQGATQ